MKFFLLILGERLKFFRRWFLYNQLMNLCAATLLRSHMVIGASVFSVSLWRFLWIRRLAGMVILIQRFVLLLCALFFCWDIQVINCACLLLSTQVIFLSGEKVARISRTFTFDHEACLEEIAAADNNLRAFALVRRRAPAFPDIGWWLEASLGYYHLVDWLSTRRHDLLSLIVSWIFPAAWCRRLWLLKRYLCRRFEAQYRRRD